MQLIGRKSTAAPVDHKLKFMVIDPVMSGGSVGPGGNAEWVPIKPTADGALIMAIIRWMFENNRINKAFLAAPNLPAAEQAGYFSYTNSTHLVILDPNHPNYRKMLRPNDLGWPGGEEDYVVIDKSSGQLARSSEAEAGELLFTGEVQDKNGRSIKIATSLSLLRESSYKYSIDDYAQACGVCREKIEEIANEFTSHGTKVGIDGMGNLAAANGYSTGVALYLLSALMGSWNLRGGMVNEPPSFSAFTRGPRYDLRTISGAPSRVGIRISRDYPYERTSEYHEKVSKGENPYPSKLPWYPLNQGMDNQAVYSMVNDYPYKTKILFNWMANLFFATPGAAKDEVINQFKNPERIPLIISVDPFMGELTAVADYVIPDTTQYESWGLVSIYGFTGITATTLRWPVVKPPMQEIGPQRYPCFETYVIDVAKRLGLPGFGPNTIRDMDGGSYPLERPEDYFLKALVNVAYDKTPVQDICPGELGLQGLDRVWFNWQQAVKPEEWKKALYVIARGGRFDAYNSDWDGDKQRNAFTEMITIYNEKIATTRNSMNGEFYEGTAYWQPEVFSDGSPVDEVFQPEEWPFKLVNAKAKLRSVSMLANAPVLTDLKRSNQIEVNILDAEALGLKSGTKVRLVSATGGEIKGELLAREGIARGTVSISFGFGHWAYGAAGYQVASQKTKGEAARGAGIMAGKISPMDISFNGVFGLSDLASGAPARNGGRYKILKA